MKKQDLSSPKVFCLRKLSLALLVTALSAGIIFEASAQTFTTKAAGKFTDSEIWEPSFPGNIIQEGTTVNINHHVKLNSDVIIKGKVQVGREASIMGSSNVIVLESGTLDNDGITIVEHITNRGTLENHHILEVSNDMVNTGKLVNEQSIVVGSILDNIGQISGDGGQLIANKKIINSNGGTITGAVDVCSNSFLNVEGGKLDSVNVSFCGNRIFNGMFLTADLNEEQIKLKLLNSENKVYQTYQILKSTDGEHFETIATINAEEIDPSRPFEFTDREVASAGQVYYKMYLFDEHGRVNKIAPVEVNNIFGK